MTSAGLTLAELAAEVGGELRGEPSLCLVGVGSLREATPDRLALYGDAKWRGDAVASRAGALLVSADLAEHVAGRPLIVHRKPAVAMARLAARLHPRGSGSAGVHPTAVVAPSARIDPTASVGPLVVVGEASEVGPGCELGSGVVLGRGVRLGAGCRLHPRVVLYDQVRLGDRVEVHAGAVLGADGFGYVADGRELVKVPQLGRLEIGDDVEIGANTTIDRGTYDATTIGAGTKLDNLVQVGHNARIGASSLLCGQVGVAGSSTLGAGVVLGGKVGVADHVVLADGIQVAGGSVVYQSSSEPGRKLGGTPAQPLASWRRQSALLSRLGELFRRVRQLEARVGSSLEEES